MIHFKFSDLGGPRGQRRFQLAQGRPREVKISIGIARTASPRSEVSEQKPRPKRPAEKISVASRPERERERTGEEARAREEGLAADQEELFKR